MEDDRNRNLTNLLPPKYKTSTVFFCLVNLNIVQWSILDNIISVRKHF